MDFVVKVVRVLARIHLRAPCVSKKALPYRARNAIVLTSTYALVMGVAAERQVNVAVIPDLHPLIVMSLPATSAIKAQREKCVLATAFAPLRDFVATPKPSPKLPGVNPGGKERVAVYRQH